MKNRILKLSLPKIVPDPVLSPDDDKLGPCSKCRFFQKYPDPNPDGTCHGSTPTLKSTGSAFPPISAKEWCRLFERKK